MATPQELCDMMSNFIPVAPANLTATSLNRATKAKCKFWITEINNAAGQKLIKKTERAEELKNHLTEIYKIGCTVIDCWLENNGYRIDDEWQETVEAGKQFLLCPQYKPIPLSWLLLQYPEIKQSLHWWRLLRMGRPSVQSQLIEIQSKFSDSIPQPSGSLYTPPINPPALFSSSYTFIYPTASSSLFPPAYHSGSAHPPYQLAYANSTWVYSLSPVHPPLPLPPSAHFAQLSSSSQLQLANEAAFLGSIKKVVELLYWVDVIHKPLLKLNLRESKNYATTMVPRARLSIGNTRRHVFSGTAWGTSFHIVSDLHSADQAFWWQKGQLLGLLYHPCLLELLLDGVRLFLIKKDLLI